MRAAVALLLAAALLPAAGCGGAGPVAGTGTTEPVETTTETETGTTTSTTEPARCSQEEGVITGYLQIAERDECGPVLRQEILFSVERLSTGPGGTVEFDTREVGNCKLRPEATVLIRPDPGTALRLLAGAIACDAETGGERIRLEAPGTEIEVTGTLFTLIASGDSTTVKVHDGTVRMRSTTESDGWQELSSGTSQAAGLVAAGEPVAVVDYQLEQWEPELLQGLTLRVITVPAKDLPALTAESAAEGGSVVTQTEEEGAVLAERQLVRALPLITTADLQGERRRQFVTAGDTVVGVGSFSSLVATFAMLRETFGPEVTLVYTPFEFPEPEEETTSTETSTTPTETGSP